MKTVLITGYDGYCGWPTTLKLLKELTECRVIGIDSLMRRQWVEEVNAKSILPIAEYDDRNSLLYEIYGERFTAFHFDICDYNSINQVIKKFRPDIILHLASQPSAPYSHIDINHCNFTQNNNTQMLRNICFSLSENSLDDTHLAVTTTTGIYGAPDFDIPEGGVVVNKMELPFPSMAGSWYHMSRCFDASNLWLASRQFKFPISEFRTSIVSGSSTEETREYDGLQNRFDCDFYFGVVTNRFCAMALSGNPLTVYGKGLQKKPMVSLEDVVMSLIKICKNEPEKKLEIYNQVERAISIVELANSVKNGFKKWFDFEVEVKHIPNPRIEDEEHQMVIDNKKFKDLIGKFSCTIENSIEQMCKDLYPYKENISNLEGKK